MEEKQNDPNSPPSSVPAGPAVTVGRPSESPIITEAAATEMLARYLSVYPEGERVLRQNIWLQSRQSGKTEMMTALQSQAQTRAPIRIVLKNVIAPEVPVKHILEAVLPEPCSPYQELAITVTTSTGKRYADIVIGLDSCGELRVLVSAENNPDEHRLAIFPERHPKFAVELQ